MRAKTFLLLPVSKWLAGELSHSALARVPCVQIYGDTPLPPKKHCPSLRLKYGFCLEDKLLISVTKGIPALLELASVLPEHYKLIIVGKRPSVPDVRSVYWTGEIDQNLFSEYLAFSDCFVSCTPEEALGLVLAEAQMCGLPIVGFGHDGTPEAITPKTGLMVGTDDNVVELLRAIVNTIETHPFKDEDIVENGMRFAKYEYGKRMLPVFMSMLEKRS